MFFCMYASATHICSAQEEKRLQMVVTCHVGARY